MSKPPSPNKGRRVQRNVPRLRVTNAHRAGVCGLMLVGLTFREACRVMGVPTLPLRDPGLLRPDWTGRQKNQRPRRWKGEELRDLEEAYRDRSLSLASLSQMFGTHPGNISTMAKEHGWPSRRDARRNPIPIAQRRLYEKLRRHLGRDEAIRELAQ